MKNKETKKELNIKKGRINETTKQEKHDEKTKGILESYSLEVDKAKVKVNIKRNDSGIIYVLEVPEIGAATRTLLDEIRNELVSVTTISMKEILDPSAKKVCFGKT